MIFWGLPNFRSNHQYSILDLETAAEEFDGVGLILLDNIATQFMTWFPDMNGPLGGPGTFILHYLNHITYTYMLDQEMQTWKKILSQSPCLLYELIRKACFKGRSQSDSRLTKLLMEKFRMPTWKFTGRKKCYLIGHIRFSDLVPYRTRNNIFPLIESSSTTKKEVCHISTWF